MGRLMLRPFCVVLALALAFCCTAHADFSMKSLNVFVNVNLDGSANVEEQLYVLINGSQSRDLYEVTRSAYSDLATWQQRTSLPEMRHHMTRVKADLSEIRVTPQAVERCNSFMGLCYATITLSYKVKADQNGSGLILIDKYKPRTTKYTLIPEALSFDQTKSGDLILPTGTVISFSIPATAEYIHFSSNPSNIAEEGEAAFRYDQTQNMRYYVGKKRVFSWTGDTLSQFQFSYEVESPLETEVMTFFRDSQGSVISFIMGPQGLAAFIIIVAAALSFYSLNKINKR
ncbi:MAG: hypothetical protein NT051_02220 [Candidatus Micrarchaeota archaeon]|nr:hypothetical protein [Candidatus Micrarchaeota archaeon]